MALARVFPRFGSYPELRSFQCLDCGHVITVEEDHEREEEK
jgi:hypothetical protein